MPDSKFGFCGGAPNTCEFPRFYTTSSVVLFNVAGTTRASAAKTIISNLNKCGDEVLEMITTIEKISENDEEQCKVYTASAKKLVGTADGYVDVGKALKQKINLLLQSLLAA